MLFQYPDNSLPMAAKCSVKASDSLVIWLVGHKAVECFVALQEGAHRHILQWGESIWMMILFKLTRL